MKNLISAFLLASSVGTAAFALDDVETREVAAFTDLNAGGNFNLVFTPAASASVRLEGNARHFDDIDVDVRGGELEILQDGGVRRWFGRQRHLDVTVYVSGPNVERFRLSRGIDARLDALTESEVHINTSTGANVDASGECVSARINTSTGSDFDGREFYCNEIRANSSTGSDAVLNARESLSANVSTGANIRSLTEPQSLRMNTSTGGNVRVGSR